MTSRIAARSARVDAALLATSTVLFAVVACTSPAPTPTPDRPAAAAKLIVTSSGAYELGPDDLSTAGLGWPSDALVHATVTHRGQIVPRWITGKPTSQKLRFFAGPITSTLPGAAAEDVYWLHPEGSNVDARESETAASADPTNPNPRSTEPSLSNEISPSAGQPALATQAFSRTTSSTQDAASADVLATVVESHDESYVPLRAADPWIWQPLVAPVTATFAVTLDQVLAGPAEIEVRLWSNVDGPATPDHHWQLGIGATPLTAIQPFSSAIAAKASTGSSSGSTGLGTGSASQLSDSATRSDTGPIWDGTGEHRLTAAVPAGMLHDGVNEIALTGPGIADAVDKVYLDSIVVRYQRRAEPDDAGWLSWTGDGRPVRLSGFSEPTVLDVTDPTAARSVELVSSSGRDHLIHTEPGHDYVAIDEDGWRPPERVLRPELEPDLAALPPADYYAIGPSDLLTPLEPLLEKHRQNGLTVQAVSAAAVFDQYGHGLAEPEAIRDFLADVRRRSSGAVTAARPRYVLLVGDFSYDLRPGAEPSDANRLPTFFVDTVFGGLTVSDERFAELDPSSGEPSLAVGRLPARSAADVKAWETKALAQMDGGVGKTDQNHPSGTPQAAESAPGSTARIVTVSDPSEPGFAGDARKFCTQLAAGIVGTCLPASSVDEALDQGPSLVAYFGHGSLTQWGKDALLVAGRLPPATRRPAGDLPVYLNMTCLTGLFTHPSVKSLTEALLFDPEGGAVTILAPTSLTLPTDQEALTTALATTLGTDRPIGDQLLAAWKAVPVDRPESRDVRRTFLLFGDPALTVRR